MYTGKASQISRRAMVYINHSNIQIDLTTTCKNLVMKLINKPAQSDCPYIGVKILDNHIHNPEARKRVPRNFLDHFNTLKKPRVYHHTGKYKMSIINCRRIRLRSSSNALRVISI